MSYPKLAVKIKPSRGFINDVPAHDSGPEFFTTCRNVLFRNNVATRLPGSRSVYDDALAIANPVQMLHALNTENAGVNYWLIFESDGAAWSLEGSNALQIDNNILQATINPYQHSSGLLNGVPVYSNSVDEPVYWDGAVLQTLPDWIATESCQFIAVFKFHLFAMNISGPAGTFNNLVKWSAAAEPGTVPASWTPELSNDAGSVELSDSPGQILCAYPLRDNLIFYKRSSMYPAQFVGGQNVFAFRKAQSSSGTLSAHSVCDVNGQHFVVTDGDIVLTDGTNRKSIGESRVKDWLFNQIDQNNFRNLFCTFSRAQNEVLVGFPEAGNQFATLGLVYDLARDSFGVRELSGVAAASVGFVNDETPSNTWASRTDVWADAVDIWGETALSAARDSLLLVKAAELVQQDTDNPVSLQASLGKNSMSFGEPGRVKFVKRVHVLAGSNFGEILVRVGGQMTPSGPTAWSSEVSLSSPDQIVNTFAVGRYISIEVRSIEDKPWRITGFEIEAEIRGYF